MCTIETLLEKLTSDQRTTLNQFRQNVSDVLHPDHDDYFLLRWLKARNFDLRKSEDMLRKSLAWRQSYGTDDILSWDPPEVLKKYWPGGVFGLDKEGHPILWQLSRDFDAKGMMKSVKRSDIIKYHVWRTEYLLKICREQSQKLGKRIGCATHISDLHGFSLKMVFSPGITDITKEVFAILEANYPENLYASYVINAPGIFSVFFNILKPFLNEETRRKLTFLGRNWQNFLLTNVVDSEHLPAHWGGSARDPDDKCTNHISHGDKVPEQYYVCDRISLDRESMNDVTIPRGGSHQVSLNVTKSDTIIRWLFETESYDINFGILYSNSTDDTSSTDSSSKKNHEKAQELRQLSRVNCHQVPEDGNMRCEKPGTYILKFDNSFSWVHSKKLYYEVELIEPALDAMFKVYGGLQDNEDDVILESTYL